MANLREYLYGYDAGGAQTPTEITVFNTNIDTGNNGGFCCLFTVPTGVKGVSGEVWAGGGAGAGGYCCTYGCGGSPGGYVEFHAPVSAGDSVTICAAGSTCCRSYNSCENGNNSYVCKPGAWCVIACGGCHGYWQCNGFNCYTCQRVCQESGGNVAGTGVTSTIYPRNLSYVFGNNWCYQHTYEVNPGPAMTGHTRMFENGCCMNRYGAGCYFGTFPGGGGMTSHTQGGCTSQCGTPGAGGQVYLIFRQDQ